MSNIDNFRVGPKTNGTKLPAGVKELVKSPNTQIEREEGRCAPSKRQVSKSSSLPFNQAGIQLGLSTGHRSGDCGLAAEKLVCGKASLIASLAEEAHFTYNSTTWLPIVWISILLPHDP